MEIEDAIRHRRTHKVYGGGAITTEALEALIDAAIWAPNHRYTEPWRFYVVHGADKLAAMDTHVQAAFDASAKDAGEGVARKLLAKKQKMTTRLASAAAVIVVTWTRSPDDQAADREDYAATACAIQNLLLSAHGRGYVSLWSTGKMLMQPAMLDFYGVPEQSSDRSESVAGVIFLGSPAGELLGRRHRSALSVTHWV